MSQCLMNWCTTINQKMRVARIPRLVSAWILICLPLVLSGQIDTGSLTGTVTDGTGARVPNARVTVTNSKTAIVTSTVTTSSGTYVFEALNPGTYILSAAASGFSTYSVKDVRINVQQTPTIDIVLTPGSTTEEVTVTAAAPLLQAQTAEIGQTIDEAAVNDMPLNGRNWTSLGQLAAGVTTAPGSITGANSSSAFYSVNGTSFNQNDFRLNGIDDNIGQLVGSGKGVLSSNSSVIPPPDAIEEFKIQNADYDAEFGHATGGIINAVVKAGGNQVHGDLWEYVRNDIFDANDYFSKQYGVPIPEYRQNQFGGTVGGPVYLPKIYDGRKRTFFFFDYQGTRIVQPSPSTSTVPTATMQSSKFTDLRDLITYNQGTRTDALNRTFPLATIFDPATIRTVAGGATDPVSGLANPSSSPVVVSDPFYTGGSISGMHDFTGVASDLNQLPASRLDPNAVKLLQVYPTPTSSGYANNFYQTPKSPQTINQYDIRIDENFSGKDILFGVFSRNSYSTYVPPTLPLSGGYGYGDTTFPAYSLSVGYTHVFNPTLTNEFRFGFNHNYQNLSPREGNTFGIPAQFGIQGVPQEPGNGGLPPISIGNLSTLGIQGWEPTQALGITLELNDNVTKVYGKHTFKSGYEIQRLVGNITQPAFSRGNFSYSGQFSAIPGDNTGLTGISDALLAPAPSAVGGADNVGGLSSFQGTNWAATDTLRYYMGAYFQDNWQATSKLTLNLGLRWDLTTPYAETRGRQANFVPIGGNGPGGIFYLPTQTCNSPRSASFDSLASADGISIKCISGTALGDTPYADFAPRLGIAYRITPKFVARAGFGIAYGALASIGFGGTLGTNYPFQYTVSFSSPGSSSPIILPNNETATMENALSAIELQDPTKVNGGGVGLEGRQFNYRTPYTESSNLTLQYQLGKSDSIQVGYVGVLGRHLDVGGGGGITNTPSVIVPPVGNPNIYDYIPFPDFAPNSTYEVTNGSSNYNSLQAVYTRELASGLSVLANFTYSKCFSDAAQFQTGFGGYRAEWLPGFGIKGDNQLCLSDSTKVLHASGQYNLPVGRGERILGTSNKTEDAFIGGWAVNFVITHQSGQPFTIGCPIATTAFFGCNANVVPGQDLYAGPHNQSQWLNPKAFANPPVATQVGQAGYSVLGGQAGQARGPGYTNIDASLFKKFSITEHTYVQFRAEAFNLANTPQFASPGNLDFTNSTAFSTITGLVGNPRLLQFALKLFY
jgi:hypothetical protein